jgi:polar amino acid transport system ATP-binding protein
MHLLGGLDAPSSGTVKYGDVVVSALSSDARAAFRGQNVGFIFQFHHLLPEFSARENVALPLIMHGASESEAASRAEELLTKVGLSHRMSHLPSQLSGGEQQRVAIARALAMQPQVMFFDEATSALDPELVKGILALIAELGVAGMTMIAVTHEMGFARSTADSVVFMDRGVVIEAGPPDQIFTAATTERLQRFLSQVL